MFDFKEEPNHSFLGATKHLVKKSVRASVRLSVTPSDLPFYKGVSGLVCDFNFAGEKGTKIVAKQDFRTMHKMYEIDMFNS